MDGFLWGGHVQILKAPLDNDRYDSQGRPQVSEVHINQHVQALEDIGYRVVGTEEAVRGEEYVYREMEKLDQICQASKVLECTLWMQQGDGSHQ